VLGESVAGWRKSWNEFPPKQIYLFSSGHYEYAHTSYLSNIELVSPLGRLFRSSHWFKGFGPQRIPAL
jgi:hypothetical protein